MANSETTKKTLTSHSNRRRVEVQVEAMALHVIVEELMTGEACVVYSNDGSAKNGMGNYVAQSFKHQWCSEICLLLEYSHKRECTIQVFSAASAYKYNT